MGYFLNHLSYWDWLALGTILLILEIFGTGGYLLWLGIAAALTGAIYFLVPDLSWIWQFLLFAVLAIATTFYWWRRQRRALNQSDAASTLNQRGKELIGRTFTLHEAISSGRGKIRVGDTLWLVTGPDLPSGARVKIVGQDGVLMTVQPSDS